MGTDYEAILARNIKEYGEGSGHLEILSRLYSDRTHCLFELLQNAEDAGATRVEFGLYDDRLDVRHDGRPFTTGDVEGICGVDASEKAHDLTKIGKFGIGFKSVYAYTRTPRIHSGDEHFRIELYVRPYAEPSVPDLSPNATLISLPFDRDAESTADALHELERALKGLEFSSLLFLRNIERLTVRVAGQTVANAERRTTQLEGPVRKVTVEANVGTTRQSSQYLIWSDELDSEYGNRLHVELAFRLTRIQGRDVIRPLAVSPLVAFFPTEKPTGLGFLLQGPFRTTPARDNVAERDPWNRELTTRAARLLSEAVLGLRDLGLLDAQALACLPCDPALYPPDSLLRPLWDATVALLRDEAVIPADPNGFVAGADARLPRVAELTSVFENSLLAELLQVERPLRWVTADISETRRETAPLWRMLRDTAGVAVLDAEASMQCLTEDFLVHRNDDWIIRLYHFLRTNEALWRARSSSGRAPVVRGKPILRLEDGTHVVPFDAQDHPRAYLPVAGTTFPTVRSAIADNVDARDFLVALGLTEPDVVAELLERTLPRYRNGEVPEDEHLVDLARMTDALSSATGPRRRRLLDALATTPFLQARNASTRELRWTVPGETFWRDPDLVLYFAGNSDAWFVRKRYSTWRDELTDAGVHDTIPVFARTPGRDGNVTLIDVHGQHARGLDGFDPAANIIGLDHALIHPDPDRSAYVWSELLTRNHHLLVGTVEESSRQTFENSTREERLSPAGLLARTKRWLPNRDGAWSSPDELSVEDLPPGFRRDDTLARALGMLVPAVEEASRALGVDIRVMRFLSRHPEEIERLQRLERTLATPDFDDDDTTTVPYHGPDVVFADAFAAAFTRPSLAPLTASPQSPSGEITNPELRRERLEAAIVEARANEPPSTARFRAVPRRVWDAKNSATRAFVAEQYHGECQICRSSIHRRDGTAYFEGVYLVSYTAAAWVDRPGNVLCLCPNCSAKLRYGPLEADDLVGQVMEWRPAREGGTAGNTLTIQLDGAQATINYTERHLLDLQQMLRLAPTSSEPSVLSDGERLSPTAPRPETARTPPGDEVFVCIEEYAKSSRAAGACFHTTKRCPQVTARNADVGGSITPVVRSVARMRGMVACPTCCA